MVHILIIEDDLLVGLDIQSWAEEVGARSTDVSSSEDNAVRLAIERRPDFITSDMRLAQGTGAGAVHRIREHYGPIPVLYITGNPEAVKAVDPDANVIVKPYSWQELEERAKALGLLSTNA